MRAMYVKAPYNFQLREIERPVPGPDEVLIKIEACGICGTDFHVAGKLACDWMPIGHEFVGSIAELGSNVQGYRIGEEVIAQNATYCGICEDCMNGHPEHCENIYTMNDQPGYAEYICMHKKSLHPFEGLTFPQATLAEPLTVALDLVQVADIPLDANVAVLGAGPIGLMAVKLAKLRGARKVYLSNPSERSARFKLGRKLGADVLLEADKEHVVETIKADLPRGVERVLVTAPPKTLLEAIEIAKYGGIIAFIGIEYGEEAEITFDVNHFHFKKLQLRASFAVPNMYFPIALDLLERRVIDPDAFITHTVRLQDVPEFMKNVSKYRNEMIKAVVIP